MTTTHPPVHNRADQNDTTALVDGLLHNSMTYRAQWIAIANLEALAPA